MLVQPASVVLVKQMGEEKKLESGSQFCRAWICVGRRAAAKSVNLRGAEEVKTTIPLTVITEVNASAQKQMPIVTRRNVRDTMRHVIKKACEQTDFLPAVYIAIGYR